MTPPRLSGHALRSLARALCHRGAARALPPRLRERLILHVSATNRCPVCADVHVPRARAAGLDDAAIGAACARDLGGDDDATRAMLRYAEVRTLDAEAAHPEAAEALARHFDAATRAGIRATIDMFTFTNRFNNTWEAILPGAARRRRRFDPA